MEFFIKQNTDFPILKMQIVKDGKYGYSHICDLIEKSAIYFSMVDYATGNPKIINAGAGFVNKVFIEPNSEPEYYLYYRFTKNDTNRVGRFMGEFTLINDEGTLVVPISDQLFINIMENFVDEGCDDNCGEPGFPCCDQDEPLSYSFDLNIIVSSGSIIVDYELVSDKILITPVTCTFTTTLGVDSGNPIEYQTQMEMLEGKTSTTETKTINADYNNLDGTVTISDLNIVFLDRSISFTTDVKSPKFDPQLIKDAILTNTPDEYIQVGVNVYLSYIDPPQDVILIGQYQYLKVGDNEYLSYKEI